jgi:phenylpyruvate tautomerase PptA (4-oxalocrotonate tautomerase family)
MPLVRIDMLEGRSARQHERASQVVHDALVETCNVPANDRFHVVQAHPRGSLVFAPDYLGIAHTEAIVFVQITLNQGRSTEQKRALYRAIADGLHVALGVGKGDVIINLVEVAKENWSFGNGDAPYAE